MVKIKVSCPICKKQGYIEVSTESLRDFSRGILAINIADKTICRDDFVIYVDKNFNIRDYFIVDFHLELPGAIFYKDEKFDQEKKFLIEKVLDLDLIKFNLSANVLVYTIKAIFLGKKFILILGEQLQFLNEHLNNFYKYITQNSFKLNFNIISRKEYDENKTNYKRYLVFSTNSIINDKNRVLNPKKIAVERRIIQKFLAETDQNLSYLMIKNEVRKAFELSKFISDYLNKLESKKKIDFTEIYKELYEKFHVNISSVYLLFLLEIVEGYYNVDIPESTKRLLKIIF